MSLPIMLGGKPFASIFCKTARISSAPKKAPCLQVRYPARGLAHHARLVAKGTTVSKPSQQCLNPPSGLVNQLVHCVHASLDRSRA